MLDEKTPSSPIDQAMMAGNVLADVCPSRQVLRQATTRWALLSLIVLRRGEMRFSDLRRAIGGISERMLAKTLQDLVLHGLLTRTSHPVVPPHVVYALTPIGAEMAERVEGLTTWIEQNIHRFPSEANAA